MSAWVIFWWVLAGTLALAAWLSWGRDEPRDTLAMAVGAALGGTVGLGVWLGN